MKNPTIIIQQGVKQDQLLMRSPRKPEELIEKLLQSPQLRGWERLFVSTISKCPKPGSRQLEKVQAIATRLGVSEGSEA